MKRRSKKAATIYITELDYNRLSGLIERTRERNGTDREYLNKLEVELDRAEILDPKDIPADVITMRSKVRLKDLVSGESNAYSLVFPTEADFAEGKISVLAPIGTAMATRWLGIDPLVRSFMSTNLFELQVGLRPDSAAQRKDEEKTAGKDE